MLFVAFNIVFGWYLFVANNVNVTSV